MSDDLVIDPDDELGSPRLAEALRARDVEQIGRALRQDVVVMPELTTAEGERQVRVFPSRDAARPYALLLFSTVARMAEFLPHETGRLFSLADGERLADFLRTWEPQLAAVVFDPGDPSSMQASVADVLSSLALRDEDVVGWIAGNTTNAAPDREAPVLIPDLAVDWTPLDIDAPESAENGRLLDRLAALRVDRRRAARLREWLVAELPRLRRTDSGIAALLFTGKRSSATTMSVESHPVEPGSLDDVAARVGAAGVERLRGPDGEILRRHRIDDTAPGGPVLSAEYWRRPPSRVGVARLAFTAPLGGDDESEILVTGILRFTDSVAARATWGAGRG